VRRSVVTSVSEMSENFVEQLNHAIEALKAKPEVLPRAGAEIESLVRLAAELHNLPRAEFRMRLKDNLMQAAIQTRQETQQQTLFRKGFHTVTPYLAVQDVMGLIEFVKKAFNAEGNIFGTGSEGGLHSEFQIGDSMVMIGGGGNWKGKPKLAGLHYFVDDVDAVYQRALEAGATSQTAPLEDHGERVASIVDVAGNEWYIAKRLSGSHTDEGLRSVNVCFHPRGAAEMVDFLKRAFAAEEMAVYRLTPGGPLAHAKIRIGDSVVEMGEAHGPWQPKDTMLHLYVDDVDAWYERAVAGGATSASEPADAPYGDRVASVTDPFGNLWYLATPIKTAALDEPAG
jgi:PhnB protein